MADFAVPTDVETAYEGSFPSGSEDRIQYLLDVANARLRTLSPTLEARIEADEGSDLAILARDAVVNAVIRKVPGSQQVQSTTQSSGPWSVTNRYTVDKSQTFTDEELRPLMEFPPDSRVGTIHLGRPNWYDW